MIEFARGGDESKMCAGQGRQEELLDAQEIGAFTLRFLLLCNLTPCPLKNPSNTMIKAL